VQKRIANQSDGAIVPPARTIVRVFVRVNRFHFSTVDDMLSSINSLEVTE
jgi:hypothetical protein